MKTTERILRLFIIGAGFAAAIFTVSSFVEATETISTQIAMTR